MKTKTMNKEKEFGSFKQCPVMPLHQNSIVERENIMAVLKLHMMNFQYLINKRKRKAHLRWLRKQRRLRNFFMQTIQEFPINYIEKLPIIIMKHVIDNTKDDISSTVTQPGVKTIDIYNDVILLLNKKEWFETFRMSYKTFTMMCVRLWQAKQESPYDTLLAMEKRIALALYIFAKGLNVHSITHMFNVTYGGILNTIKWFVNIFEQIMVPLLIKMPKTEEESEEIRTGFQGCSTKCPLVVGVINVFQFGNAIVQTLIDDCLLFRKIEISDKKKPELFLCHNNDLKYTRWLSLNNITVSTFVAAPNYYPMTTWLMKPYDNPQISHEIYFNETMDDLFTHSENAVDRLFGRWKILTTLELIDDYEFSTNILRVCCALHNMLEDLEEFYDDEWLSEVNTAKFVYKQPNEIIHYYDDPTALAMRDVVAQWMDK